MSNNLHFLLILSLLATFICVHGTTEAYKNSFSPSTFDYYTAIWTEQHSQWIGVDETIRRCSPSTQMVFPVCVNGSLITEPQNFLSNSALDDCPSHMCTPTLGGCGVTPSDSIDYLAPALSSTADNDTICAYNGPSSWISSYTLGLDQGIPPEYTPFLPVKMLVEGRVTVRTPAACLPVDNAEVNAWQIDPTKLSSISMQFPFVLNRQPSALGSSSLRNVSSVGRVHTDSEGGYSLNSLMPPSYGPPRHIMLKVSAPGYQTLLTRIYFDKDWRLQQLTTLGKDGLDGGKAGEQSRGIYSLPQIWDFLSDRNETNKRFPGIIANDPRVASLEFVEEDRRAGQVKGYFKVKVDITLSPVRSADANDRSVMPSIDLDGVWSDPSTGQVLVETHGHFFHAREIPHPRTWGTVSGYLVGNTIRGVSFLPARGYVHRIQDSEDNGRLSTSLIALSSTYTSGVVVPSDPFSSAPFSTDKPGEISILWSGAQYESIWSKLDSSLALGYRFLKLTVIRDTGGRVAGTQGGTLRIREIQYFAGQIGHVEYPTLDNKMRTPRFPIPQVVSCSSYTNQEQHCYKAFDGDTSSNSIWITEAVGSKRTMIAEPQWILLDLGIGRGARPTAVRIVCAESCPRAFIVQGSRDNVKYDTLFMHDYKEYNDEYRNNSDGVMFYFGIDSVQGRLTGQRCGSCDIGPKFSCHLSAFDGTCNTHYCGADALCAPPPVCPPGRYLSLQYSTYAMPSFICSLCPAGRYGNASGLQSAFCSGRCSAGYFCPAGSSSPTEKVCGGRHVFCPEGSAQPIYAPAGRYTASIVDNSTGSVQTHSEPCAPGSYCMNGVQVPCPVGVYGNVDSLATASCSAPCRAGTHCPEGSVVPKMCAPGSFCPDGQVAILCPAGRYGAVHGLKDIECSGLCQPGFFCLPGSVSPRQVPCPAGRYGDVPGLKNSNCSGLCFPGYYCPSGSSSGKQMECGGSLYYCPLGSVESKSVSKGYYSAGGGENWTVHYLQIEAPVGYFALEGRVFPCPAGSYGNITGLSADEVPPLFPMTVSPTASPTFTSSPSIRPSARPSYSFRPTVAPTVVPTNIPSTSPSIIPTVIPTVSPSRLPTRSPTVRPSALPSTLPTVIPTPLPTAMPTPVPSPRPTVIPTVNPTASPSVIPTVTPTITPTASPSISPTVMPTQIPTISPSPAPSIDPTLAPTVVSATRFPTARPSTRSPTASPSRIPTTLPSFSFGPTPSPSTIPTLSPSRLPTLLPSMSPSMLPTRSPSVFPTTASPTATTVSPTIQPSPIPSLAPTESTLSPSLLPSVSPSRVPSATPSRRPSRLPTVTPSTAPSATPSRSPTLSPSYLPTTSSPSETPSRRPSAMPSGPTMSPTPWPTYRPSLYPTLSPSQQPTVLLDHTLSPTSAPTRIEEYVRLSYICSGACEPGYFCPPNSTSSTQFPCPAGRYGSSPGLATEHCTDVCPLGSYCPPGSALPLPCPAGRYGGSVGLKDSMCSTVCTEGVGCDGATSLCEAGWFCPTGSISARQYSCGSADKYCPRGSAAPTVVAQGYYTIGGNESTRVSRLQCELGNFCVDGKKFPCPAGRYGETRGLSNPSCSGACFPGHFCPQGTVLGTSFKCPAGRFGSSHGLENSACDGACEAGYHCPEASTSPKQLQCAILGVTKMANVSQWEDTPDSILMPASPTATLTNVYLDSFDVLAVKSSVAGQLELTVSQPNKVYCPVASSLPLTALPGYYTIGTNRSTRSDQVLCPAGSYCVDGVKFSCPAGSFGDTTGQHTDECSGLCAKGYFCLAGSTVSRQYACPAGRYGDREGLADAMCSGTCANPLACPQGSIKRA